MLLSIQPPLGISHFQTLSSFSECSTHSEIGMPSTFCMWAPSSDGLFLCAPDICSELNQPYMKWLMYLIQNFIEPWGYALTGVLFMKSFYCIVKRNEITLESLKNERIQFMWNPQRGDVVVHKSCRNTLKHLMVQIGITEWELVDTIHPIEQTKSMIDPLNRKMYMHDGELYRYCKTIGMKNVLKLIQKKIDNLDKSAVMSSIKETESSPL